MFLQAGISSSSSPEPGSTHPKELAFLGVTLLAFAANVTATGNIPSFSHYLPESVKGAVFFTLSFLGSVLIIAEIYYRSVRGESLWPE